MKRVLKLMVPFLCGILLSFFLLCGGCGENKDYRVITNPQNKMVYNIPAEFPDPFNETEMKSFEGIKVPTESNTVTVIYNKVVKRKVVGLTYGLIFDGLSQMLVAAITVNEDNTQWNFWIYELGFPIECTKKRQQEFLTAQEWLGINV